MTADLLERLITIRVAYVARLRAGVGRGPSADEAKRRIAALDDQIGRLLAEQGSEKEHAG